MDLDEPSQYILQYKSTVVYYMYKKMCGDGRKKNETERVPHDSCSLASEPALMSPCCLPCLTRGAAGPCRSVLRV